MDNLTPKQEKFVHEYIKTLNAGKSAKLAGYSEKTANQIGSKLLKDEKIKAYIDEQKQKIFDESILETQEILHLLSKIATGETKEEKEVVLKDAEFITNPSTNKKTLVYRDRVEIVEVEPKMSDRNRAFDLLGKYHAIWTDKKELSGNTPIVLTIGEYEDDSEIKQIHDAHDDRPMLIDDIPSEK